MKKLSRFVNLSRLPIFRSEEQARLLAVLFVLANEPATLTEIAARAEVSMGVTHKEVEALEAAGLVVSQRRGNARLVEVDPSSPLVADLRALLTKAFGPVPAIENALAGIPGIDDAFVFGSLASIEVHEAPHDVDLMIIGEPDLDEVYEAIGSIEDLIGLPINVVVRTHDEWEVDDSGFARNIKHGHRIPLELG